MSSRKSSRKATGKKGSSGKSTERKKKRCTSCGRLLVREQFNQNKDKKDGLSSHCRECLSLQSRARWQMRRLVMATDLVRHFLDNRKKVYTRNESRIMHPELKECAVEGCHRKGQRHHVDYRDPFAIVWLCDKHHGGFHRVEKMIYKVAAFLGLRIPGEG